MNFNEYFKNSPYTRMAINENYKQKVKHKYTIVVCCKCGKTNTTLYKLGKDKYICLECKKQLQRD